MCIRDRRTPDKREVGGSSPLKPTPKREKQVKFIYNRKEMGKGSLKPNPEREHTKENTGRDVRKDRPASMGV